MPPKFTDVRRTKGLGPRLICINTAQELRKCLADGDGSAIAVQELTLDQWIDWCIADVKSDFMNSEFKCVLECVSPEGEFIDHSAERTINPGHAIEAAWFILDEARHRNDDRALRQIGLTILDWSLAHGWDQEFGGLFSFVDVRGFAVCEPTAQQKFWWPHCEALIATMMASLGAKENSDEAAKYADWHEKFRRYVVDHFVDDEFGEWFGYLNRDGRPVHRAKGNLFKGPFHIPRMFLICRQLLSSEIN